MGLAWIELLIAGVIIYYVFSFLGDALSAFFGFFVDIGVMWTLAILACIPFIYWLYLKNSAKIQEKKNAAIQIEKEKIAENKRLEEEARRVALMKKYNNSYIVSQIVANRVWQGQTRDQLIESLGYPEEESEVVMKTKTKETFKYHRISKSRFGLHVKLEDGVVVGWENKA